LTSTIVIRALRMRKRTQPSSPAKAGAFAGHDSGGGAVPLDEVRLAARNISPLAKAPPTGQEIGWK